MTIEGLGKKFQEARLARKLALDEAARMTKIRPQRLAEIEADDFSQFPSLAYAKGFLLIYGKFLDVDVTPYLDAFEDSESVTVDGYSYLQENERVKPVAAPVVRRRPAATRAIGGSNRVSPMGPPETRKALAANSTASAEPEVRKAKPVTKEDLAQAPEGANSPPPESDEQNRVAIQPLKRTYVRVTLGDDGKAAFERWVSPADGPVEFRGKHVSIRVLDPEAIKITKNGQELQQNDQDVTVN
jgi:cytoskeletal protein RodZ